MAHLPNPIRDRLVAERVSLENDIHLSAVASRSRQARLDEVDRKIAVIDLAAE